LPAWHSLRHSRRGPKRSACGASAFCSPPLRTIRSGRRGLPGSASDCSSSAGRRDETSASTFEFELSINLKAARALDLTLRSTLLAVADEGDRMRRRQLIAMLAAAGLVPAAVPAQQAAPVIGFLSSTSLSGNEHNVVAFRSGLEEGGYVEGRNVAIEYRWAEGDFDRLPSLAAELTARGVTVLVATGSTATALAAKAATTTIPVVFRIGGDPVQAGIVNSLSRPGGNVTGIAQLTVELFSKRVQLLRDLVPGASRIAFLIGPSNPGTEVSVRNVEQAARALGMRAQIIRAANEADVDAGFTAAAGQHAAGLILAGDLFFNTEPMRRRVIAAAARHKLPVIYPRREFVAEGGLMSYAADQVDTYRQVGAYAAKILKGAKPADLPVEQVDEVRLVINLKAAAAMELEIPQPLLLRADEVIE
jgi:putative tryptophan/tyrosine transport system substrate-binding protein